MTKKINLYLVGGTEREMDKAHSFCEENHFDLKCYSKQEWEDKAFHQDDHPPHEETSLQPRLIPGQVKSVDKLEGSSSNLYHPFKNMSHRPYSRSNESNEPMGSSENVIPFERDGFLQKKEGSSMKKKTLEEREEEAIIEAVQDFKGNLTEAAKSLGVGRATLYRKIKIYRIDVRSIRQKKVA